MRTVRGRIMMARRQQHKPTYSIRRDDGRLYIPPLPCILIHILVPVVELVD
jgi:hypothetical protein